MTMSTSEQQAPTMSVRDAILEKNRLARMRQGQAVPEMLELHSMPGIRVAQVPLTESEAQRGVIAAANLDVAENIVGMQARTRAAVAHDVWMSLREPGDLGKQLFVSLDEMNEILDPRDIDSAHDLLSLLMDYASPAMEGLTAKDLDDLKKDLAALDWSALTGRQWAALKLALRILLPIQLRANLSGSSSTESSTERSDEPQST